MTNWRNRPRSRNQNSNQNRQSNFHPLRSQLDSNGPAGRIRGNAQQICDKYQNLAREAQGDVDRILQESFWQYAEHYQRMLNEFSDRDNRERGERGEMRESNNGESDNYEQPNEDIEINQQYIDDEPRRLEKSPKSENGRNNENRADMRTSEMRSDSRNNENRGEQQQRQFRHPYTRNRPNRFDRSFRNNESEFNSDSNSSALPERKRPIERTAERYESKSNGYEQDDDELPGFLRERSSAASNNQSPNEPTTIRRKRAIKIADSEDSME